METAQELLFEMRFVTRDQARQRLSDEGREVLDMIELVSRTSKISVVDAWVEARATATLSEDEKDVLVAYVARMSLIEAFDRQLQEEEQQAADES